MNGVESGKPLAPLTTIGLGGSARFYAVARDRHSLQELLAWSRSMGLPVWVLSGGSNIVVSDSNLEGLVLDIQLRGMKFERESSGRIAVTVAAGEGWDAFVNETVRRGYSGIECLSGIPGRVGATPIQNVGAYGQEVSHTIRSVDVIDRSTGELFREEASECNFGYRTSRFKQADLNRYIVVSVSFSLFEGFPEIPSHRELLQKLKTNSQPTVQEARDAVLGLRRAKSMLVDDSDASSRSCGSFFVNPVVSAPIAEAVRERYPDEQVPIYRQPENNAKIAAAWLIEKAGFNKGDRDGSVGISEMHSLAIVTRPGATARDVVGFAKKIQRRVYDQFGIWLVPEPIFWGFERTERGLPVLD
jgi:UDP-N-acetylmuramate dehydrogenase